MNFRINPLFLLLAASATLWTACDDVIDLELPDAEPRLSVEATITNLDTVQMVRLTYSANYFSNAPAPAVSGALVVLTDELGAVDTFAENSADGVYLSEVRKTIGRSYTLFIRTPDGKTYQSEPQLLREPVPIDSIYWEYEPNGEFDNDSLPPGGYNILIVTTEPAGAGDFYRWRNYINGTFLNEPSNLQFSNDNFVDGNTTTGFYINSELVPPGGRFRVEQMRISEDMYNYLNLLITQTAFVGGPFDPPPAPIPSNIRCLSDPDEKVYGFFCCAGTSVAEIIVPD